MNYYLLIFLLLLSACSSAASPGQSSTLMASPTPQPFPTRQPAARGESSRALAIMHVAGTLLSVDIGVHPQQGWPAVVAVDTSLTTRAAPRVFVRAYNPVTHRWGSTQSLGSQGSALFSRFRTAQIAISADNTIHVIWGPGRNPWLGLYASESRDYGETWSAPSLIARGTYGVLDLATAQDGTLIVLANSEAHGHPLLIRRTPKGQWHNPEVLPMTSWYGSAGALAVSGEGQQTNITVLTSGGGGKSADNTVFSAQSQGSSWSVERHVLSAKNPDILRHIRALSLSDGTLFTVAMANHGNVYTLTFRNGQRTPEISTVQNQRTTTTYSAAAYDPLTQRRIVFWTCCADATFRAAESTHYVRWMTSDGDIWQPQEAQALLTGAISAADLASAQASNSRQVWLAWAESVHDVMVRSLDLELVQ